jgi:outer membrane protein assembly factor BamA
VIQSLSPRVLGRQSVLLLLLCLVEAMPLHAQLTAPAHQIGTDVPPGDVVVVKFEGNHALSEAELATVTATKVTGFFSRFLYYYTVGILKWAGAPYQKADPATLSRDTAALNLYYKDHGFISAKSRYRVVPNFDDAMAWEQYLRHEKLQHSPGQKRADPGPTIQDTVIFSINEGPPYTIDFISFSGLENLPNEFQPELNERVTIKHGQQWSRAAAANEANRLADIMVERGYPNFRSDTIVVENPEGSTKVHVNLYFTTGHRYRYGETKIVWDTNTAAKSRVAAKVIKAQLMTHQGDWYSLSEIQRSEANLMKLNTFDLVRVSLDTGYIGSLPDSLKDGAEVPLVVLLRMRLEQEIPVNVYAGQSVKQGILAGFGAGYINRNMFRMADNFNFQLALQPLPATQLRYSANIDYQLPYMPFIGPNRLPLLFGVGYSIDTQKRVADIPAHFISNFSTHLGTNAVISERDNNSTLGVDLLGEYTYASGDAEVQKFLPHNQVNFIPIVSWQDLRGNDPINPTSGNILNFSIESGLPLGFTYNGHPSSDYLKPVLQAREYFDLSNNGWTVVATRLKAGVSFLWSGDSLRYPSFNHRFFGGGATSNRGWADQSLLVSADPTARAEFGGFSDLEYNLELRYAPFRYAQEFTSWQKMSGAIRVVLFYDIGNVWDQSLNRDGFHFNDLAQTVGFGLRFNTFFGALRADWGLKFYDPSGLFTPDQTIVQPGANKGQYFFQGHHPIAVGSTFNWHFGIGQAF